MALYSVLRANSLGLSLHPSLLHSHIHSGYAGDLPLSPPHSVPNACLLEALVAFSLRTSSTQKNVHTLPTEQGRTLREFQRVVLNK